MSRRMAGRRVTGSGPVDGYRSQSISHDAGARFETGLIPAWRIMARSFRVPRDRRGTGSGAGTSRPTTGGCPYFPRSMEFRQGTPRAIFAGALCQGFPETGQGTILLTSSH